MVSRPLLISLTIRAKFSGPVPKPGKFFGQEVTSFHLMGVSEPVLVVCVPQLVSVFCPQAARVAPAAPMPSVLMNCLRFMVLSCCSFFKGLRGGRIAVPAICCLHV